jgi:superkiller protein 3
MRHFPPFFVRSCGRLGILACLLPAAAQTTADTPPVSRPAIQAEDITHVRVPDDFPSWNIRADDRDAITVGLKSGTYDNVEKTLAKLAEQNPKSPRLLTFLARIFFVDRKYLNCAIALKKAEKLEPLRESDQFTLALCYVILKRTDWASEEFEKLARSNPGNALYPYWQGRVSSDRYEYPAAIERFNKALELEPEFSRAYDNLGLCFEAMSDNESAAKNYERAVSLNRSRLPASPWPPLNYGMLLLRQGSLDRAEALLREAVDLGPAMPLTHHQLGAVLAKQKKSSDAIDELKKAVELDPTYAEAHFTLAYVYRQLGDNLKADLELETFQKLKQAQKDRDQAAGSGQTGDRPR